MRKEAKERGSVIVEASIILPIFTIVMFFLINIINLYLVHNRIQFALNAVAKEISGYSYLYEITGLNDGTKKIEEDGKPYTEKIDNVINEWYETKDNSDKTKKSGSELMSVGQDFFREVKSIPGDVSKVLDDVVDKSSAIYEEVIKLPGEADTLYQETLKDLTNTYHEAEKIPEDLKKDLEKIANLEKDVVEAKNTVESAKTNFFEAANNIKNFEFSPEYLGKVIDSTETAETSLNDVLKLPENMLKKKQEEVEKAISDLKAKIEGLQQSLSNIKEKATDSVKEKIVTFQSNVGGILKSVEGEITHLKETVALGTETWNKAKETYTNAVNTAKSGSKFIKDAVGLVKNPKDTARGVGFIAVEGGIYKLKGLAAEGLAYFMAKKYIETEDQTANEYLTLKGVVGGYGGLSFKGSSYLNDPDKKMMDLIVTYKFDLSKYKIMGKLGEINITQRVTIPAWLSGNKSKNNKVREDWKAKKK